VWEFFAERVELEEWSGVVVEAVGVEIVTPPEEPPASATP